MIDLFYHITLKGYKQKKVNMENFTIDTTLYPIADNPSILLSESYPTFAPMNEMQSLDFWDF